MDVSRNISIQYIMNSFSSRGPIRHIILAATGHDIRTCVHCGACNSTLTSAMDLTLGELFQAAARDDPVALGSRTLWACDPLLLQRHACQARIDLAAVINALRQEALLRGHPRLSQAPDTEAEP